MKQGTKLLIVVIALVLTGVGAAIYAGAHYVTAHKDEWLAEAQATHKAGLDAGKVLAEDACVKQAMSRYAADTSIAGGVESSLWMGACLETSQLTKDFCTDVPGEDEFGATVSWRVATCTGFGLQSQPGCGSVLAPIQKYCHGAIRAHKTPSL